MRLQELYNLIHLQPEMIEKLDIVEKELELTKLEPYLERLQDMETASQAYRELRDMFPEDGDRLRVLYCQLECARRAFDRYQEKQIPKKIYADTMKCFTRFLDECKEKNGRMFFDRGWWTYRQTSLNLFRIGELEYEVKEYEGEPALDIHIPSDADLSPGAVDDSLKQADDFFARYFKMPSRQLLPSEETAAGICTPYDSDRRAPRYICNSWLLSPSIRPFLPQKSHILSFQDRFRILRENKEDKEYIEWLFHVPMDTDYEALPAATSLQRGVKELCLQGGTVGTAFGVME